MCSPQGRLTEAAKHGLLIDLELVALYSGWGSIRLRATTSLAPAGSQTPDVAGGASGSVPTIPRQPSTEGNDPQGLRGL